MNPCRSDVSSASGCHRAPVPVRRESPRRCTADRAGHGPQTSRGHRSVGPPRPTFRRRRAVQDRSRHQPKPRLGMSRLPARNSRGAAGKIRRGCRCHRGAGLEGWPPCRHLASWSVPGLPLRRSSAAARATMNRATPCGSCAHSEGAVGWRRWWWLTCDVRPAALASLLAPDPPRVDGLGARRAPRGGTTNDPARRGQAALARVP